MALIFKNTGQGGNITIKNNGLGGSFKAIESTRPVASGVALQIPTPSQYISYRTGDVGWRWQNGWFSSFIQPTNPLKVANLDYNQNATNSWFILTTPLTVGGVSNTIRFVDVTGVQTFSAVNNKNLVVIDKLTGMMFTRSNVGANNQWNGCIDDAFNGSITVEGVIYNDWYLNSINEMQQIFGIRATSAGFIDSATGITIANTTSAGYTADTSPADTGRAFQFLTVAGGFTWTTQGKTSGGGGYRIWVRNAQNLIS